MTVCGPVASIRYDDDDAFVNLGVDYPDDDRFVLVVWDVGANAFTAEDDVACAFGEVGEFDGAAQIQLHSVDEVNFYPAGTAQDVTDEETPMDPYRGALFTTEDIEQGAESFAKLEQAACQQVHYAVPDYLSLLSNPDQHVDIYTDLRRALSTGGPRLQEEARPLLAAAKKLQKALRTGGDYDAAYGPVETALADLDELCLVE
jgi:hypothetical protein